MNLISFFCLFFFVSLLFASESSCAELQKQKHIFFASPPAYSHVSLLRELAIGLTERFPGKYRITFGTSGRFLKAAADVGLATFNLARDVPECQEMPSDVSVIRLDEDPFARISRAAALFASIYDCQFDATEALFRADPPDLVILDFFQQSTVDLCARYAVDWLPLASMGMAGFEDHLWLPDGFVGSPLASMHSFSARFWKIAALAKALPALSALAEEINRPRVARGFPPGRGIADLWQRRLVLVPEPWAFHPARPTAPSTQLLGFLATPADSPRAASLTDPQQDALLFSWLDGLPSGADVALVAFGSHAIPPAHTVATLVEGLLAAGPQVTVLLAAREAVDVAVDAQRVRREAWVPQRRLLAHPKVKLFVSHGGLSSVSEAVDATMPLLLVPLMADQPRNAFFLQDQGAGVVVRPQGMTREDVRDAAKKILADHAGFQRASAKIRAVSAHMGGRLRGAEVIDFHMQYGSEHLLSVAEQFSLVERYDLDILAVVLCVLLAVLYLLKRLLCWLLCRKTKID